MENNAVMTVLFKEEAKSEEELGTYEYKYGAVAIGIKTKNYLSVELRKWQEVGMWGISRDCDRVIEVKQTIDGVDIPDYHSYALGPYSHAIRLAVETFDSLLAQNPKLSKKDIGNA